ncbi:transcriptional regulator [Streptomyces sp. NPDC057654]|uniref:transcriptional regulator n=1 Tax=Streptomyces sp. NPDC057654 TaxID=3346196 RepID=UPI0036B9DE89
MNADPPQSPSPALDEAFHSTTRLAIAAFLSGCSEAEFGLVRDHCRVSDSVLSKAAATLETAGYAEIRKGYAGKRPRTWLSLTASGHHALSRHVTALQNIVAAAREASLNNGGRVS